MGSFFSFGFTLAVFLLACPLPCASHALDAPPGLSSSVTRRIWRAQDGLPDQTVQAFAQTSDGYLWIGTKGGLLRFDGARFVEYDHANTPGLGESSVNCLLATGNGSLWIGTEGGGLYHYRGGVFRAIPTEDGHSDSFVRFIFKDTRGRLWVGGDQGLFRVSGDHLERIDGSHGVPAIFVRAIAEDAQANIWVGGTLLLRIGPHGKVLQVPFPGGPNHNLVTTIGSRGGDLWFGTLSGLRMLDADGHLHTVGNPDWTIQTLQQSSDGALWIGTLGNGVLRYDDGSFERAVAPNDLPSNTVFAIFEDREHDMWLGTQSGMERLTASPVTILPFPVAADTQFETIYGDRDGTVWCAATHLFHIRGDRVELATIPGLPPGTRVRTLLRDRSGTLWVGTDGQGVFHIGSHGARQYAVYNGMGNNFPRVLLQAADGSIWVGTDGGVSHITANGVFSYNTPQGLAYFSVTALLEDTKGALWIGTSRGLSDLCSGRFVQNAATRTLSREKIWSLYQDESGALWIGTSNGLYRFQHGALTRYSTQQGLPENVIYQVLGDDAGHLWLSSPGSVAEIDREALAAQLTHSHPPPLSVMLYPIAQDFGSAVLYSGMQPAGFLDAHGNAWFPSNKGAVRIRAAHVPHSAVAHFPVVIDSLSVDGLARPIAQSVILSPGTARVEVGFAAILLRSQQGLRYRYRLEGFDRTWNDAYGSHVASYTNLHPGTYRLRVQAYEVSNPSAIAQASLTLVQQPHFYKTEWFALLCVFAIVLLILAAHRLRMRQVAMRFQAVLEERNRLAREMHDTLIQDCAGVSALLEAVSKLDFADKALCHELIDHARQQVTTTIDETRSAVWDLRHSSLQGENIQIQLAIGEVARETQNRVGLPVECIISGEAFPLSGSDAHEVLMIVREAFANAARHAKAGRLQVRLHFSPGSLKINIEDDGIGFAILEEPAQHEDIHYGLRGMRERADKLDAVFSLESVPGAGTKISLTLPRRTRVELRNSPRRAS